MSSNRFAKGLRYSLRWLPDELYIQLNYFGHFHKFANLKEPATFNEKLNWLKLHDHDSRYTSFVDKYEAKRLVEDVIGEEYIIPTLGVWNTFDDIDFDILPDQFVLKCTHDSEGIIIVGDKNKFDKKQARVKLNRLLSRNFYYIGREWPYKNIEPRIIAEPYIYDSEFEELRDYKFFCFDGEPKALFVASNRLADDVRFDFYDMDFNHLNIRQKYLNSIVPINKPKRFDDMIRVSRLLSKGFKHIRIDLYEANGRVYFGEMTFYHFSGFVPFEPREWDLFLGRLIDLDYSNV